MQSTHSGYKTNASLFTLNAFKVLAKLLYLFKYYHKWEMGIKLFLETLGFFGFLLLSLPPDLIISSLLISNQTILWKKREFFLSLKKWIPIWH